jgi:hypothetical protein
MRALYAVCLPICPVRAPRVARTDLPPAELHLAGDDDANLRSPSAGHDHENGHRGVERGEEREAVGGLRAGTGTTPAEAAAPRSNQTE